MIFRYRISLVGRPSQETISKEGGNFSVTWGVAHARIDGRRSNV